LSLKLGNEYFKKGLYNEAIEEYKKVNKTDFALYKQADFNIKLIEKKLAAQKTDITTKTNLEVNEKTPAVSIIISVYNAEKYLRNCLDSVINQTLRDIEIVCINDGSTDSSPSILKEYEKKDRRIIVLNIKNQGLGAARNRGLDITNAQYVMFLDSDDWLELDALKSCYNAMINNDVDIVIGNALCIPEDETLIDKAQQEQKWFDGLRRQEEVFKFDGKIKSYISTACLKLYKKSIINKYNMRFPEGLIQEDEAWQWYYFSIIENIYYLDKRFYNRLTRKGSIMQLRDAEGTGAMDMIFIIEHIYDYLILHKLYDQYKTEFIDFLNTYTKSTLDRCKPYGDLYKKAQIETKRLQQKCNSNNNANNNPKVSVIIPVYNAEPYLRQCLDSIINQTLKDIEIICIDDSSSDNSFFILNEYANKDKRFIILKQKNSGAAVARNRGLKIIDGEYFVFMDSDDFYPNNTIIEQLYNTVKKHKVFVCGGSLLKCDRNGNEIENRDKNSYFIDDELINFDNYQNAYGFTRFIYNTRLCKDNNLFFPILERFEDPPFFVSYMAIAKKFYALKDFVYCYRLNNRAITFYNAQKTIDLLKGVKICLELSKKYNYKELYHNMVHKISYDKYVIDILKEQIANKNVLTQLKDTLSAINKDTPVSEFTKRHMKLPKVSLIIPVYNVEKYLRRCLDSAINQTLKDIEIICINDGSTDNSLFILKEYEKKDSRITLINQKNSGLGASRNIGIDITKSNYIMFIDSDDWIESDTLEAHYEIITNESVDVVMGNFLSIPEDESLIEQSNKFQKYYSSVTKPEGKYSFGGNFTEYRSSACCKLYKKEIIDEHNLRFPVGLINEDQAWHWYYFAHVNSIYCMEKSYYNRLVRKNSIMYERDINATNVLDMVFILKHIFDYLVKQDLYNKYNKYYIEYFKNNKKAILIRCSKDLNLKYQAEKELNDLENKFSNQPSNIFDEKYYIFSKEAVISSLVSTTLPYLFDNPSKLQTYENINNLPQVAFLWGSGKWYPQKETAQYAISHNIPLLKLEDGFLRSADTWCNNMVPKKYTDGISFTVTDNVHYFDATQTSRLEQLLNDENIIITEPKKDRARKCIDKIVQNYLTKYNHQLIFTPKIGRNGIRKILVVDQSYGDFSILKGLANAETFQKMLNAAIEENPNADIIIKTHPDTMAAGTTRKTGYYSNLTSHNNIYVMTEPINPISLIQYCDKIYVCTTQVGFEALMCGKEVHVFGMPFYAGWGLTYDRQVCERRTRTHSIEGLFYITYIMYSYYVNPKTQTRCEIEDAIKYLIDIRDEYNNFKKITIAVLNNIKDVLKDKVLTNVQLKYNLRMWDNRIVVIDILDMQMAYDITIDEGNIIIKIVLRKDGDRNIINELYPSFPKDKDRKIILTTPLSTMKTLLIDFMKKEINKIAYKKLSCNEQVLRII
jgi:capsular polysaccharide export protein